MKFKPNFSSLHIPFTQTYLVFRSQKKIQSKICETLDLLTIGYSKTDNEFNLSKADIKVKISSVYKISIVTFTIKEIAPQAQHIKDIIAKSLCLIQK